MNAASLVSDLNQIIQSQSAIEVGIAAHDLSSGEELLIHPDRSYHAASTMKICVMMEAFRQAQGGTISLEDGITIKNEFASLADGSPYSLSVEDDSEKDLYGWVGKSLSIRMLLERMITVSSNLATNLLIEIVSAQATTAFMQQLGGDGVRVLRGVEDGKAFRLGLNNAVTSRGLMQILLKLARREVVNHESSATMINILARQQFNEMIPAMLPAQLRVAHKTGWTGAFYHDAAIIDPDSERAIVLVVLTQGFERDVDAFPFIATIAKKVYEHWEK